MEQKRIESPMGFEPASAGDMNAVWRALRRSLLMGLECCIPAIIVKYDRDTHLADVKPLVKMVSRDDGIAPKERAPILQVQVQRIRHGDFTIDIPYKKGDTGWLIASDRVTSNVKKRNSEEKASDNKGPQEPENFTLHSFADGVFIPDKWGEHKIKEEVKESLIVQTLDGSADIVLDPDGTIHMKAKAIHAEIAEDADFAVGGTATLTAPSVVVNGNVSVAGSITATGDVTAGGISLTGHTHTDSMGGSTSAPQ